MLCVEPCALNQRFANKVERCTQLENTLREEAEIDERESLIEATFASAKGGGNGIGKTSCGKGVNILAIVDRHEPALSVSTLVQLSFDFYVLASKPEHLIGDRAYDTRWDR